MFEHAQYVMVNILSSENFTLFLGHNLEIKLVSHDIQLFLSTSIGTFSSFGLEVTLA